MAGIDPIYVLVFITVIVGVVSLVVFLSPTVPSPQPTVTAVKSSKKKKPSSGSKSKPSASKKKHAVAPAGESATELNASEELSETEQQPKAAVKFEDSLPAAPVNITSEEPSTVFAEIATEETEPKKGKKAKETPEQKEARLQRAKLAKEKSKETVDVSQTLLSSSPSSSLAADIYYNPQISVPTTSTPQHFDGWAIVDDKRKGKSKKGESDATPDAEVSTPTPTPAPAASVPEPETAAAEEVYSEDLIVESKRLGLLIGPKGVTKIAIQEATGATINVPRAEKAVEGAPATPPPANVTITITGPHAGVVKAISALNELINKGYTTLLTPENFVEGNVTVNPKFLPDIIGKGGASIKAIQNYTGVKITTPASSGDKLLNGRGQPATKIKIGIAGLKEKVSIARNLILEITRYYHTPITHPGIVHKELEIDSKYFNFIIGTKGSEIKHIQANYKVSVHIPNEETHHENLLIVGEPANVEGAERHIMKLVEKVDTIEAEKRLAVVQSGNGSGRSWQPAPDAAAAAAAAVAGPAVPPTTDRRGGNRGGRGNAKPAAAPEPPNEDEEWMAEFDRSNKAPLALSVLLPEGYGVNSSASTPAVADSAAVVSASAAEVTETSGDEGAAAETVAPSAPSSAWKDIASKKGNWE